MEKPVIASLTPEKDIRKNQEDHIKNKCTFVCFNVLSSVLLDTKNQHQQQEQQQQSDSTFRADSSLCC